MTDEEREAEIRKWYDDRSHAMGVYDQIDGPFLLRLLDAARAKIARLTDDPEMDATDAAHPAWWRGDDHGSKIICAEANAILDGKQPTGTCNEPWEALRQRLWRLTAELGRIRQFLDGISEPMPPLGDSKRLIAPPAASALEEAKEIFRAAHRAHSSEPPGGKNLTICEHEAVAAALEARERRGREAMQEETAQAVELLITDNDPCYALKQAASAIRVLPLDPPREDRWLTT